MMRRYLDTLDALLTIGLLVVILGIAGCLPTYPHKTDSMQNKPYDLHEPGREWSRAWPL